MEMGEAASPSCLLRSNSQPLFASCEFKEGDPIRALTTSISFGRFLTEPLNWERWSSFSHNRTLEDVQKYSRPGVVAEKKAFFEAHYKNFALKKTANENEKENQAPLYNSPQNNVITNISPVFSKSGNNDDIISSANEDVPSPSTNLVFSRVCDAENNVPSTSQVEKVKMSTENVDKTKKRRIKDAASDPDKLSAKSLSRNEPCKKPQSPRKKAAVVVTDKKRSVFQSLHTSMNFSPARNKDVASKTKSKPNDRLTQQANTRSKTLSERLVNGSKKATSKSHSTTHSETSSPCTKKPRSPTVPSSFSFRSDERAAKRKEFFKKVEEKTNTNDTKLKEKARSDNKKLRWSTAVEVKPKAPIKNMQKVTPTKPCSPKKLGRKPAPKPVEDTQSPPWRSSSSKPKNFIEINKQKLRSYTAKKK